MQGSANPIQDLRAQLLATDPQDLGLAPSKRRPHVWGVLMDIGFPEGTVTLIALGEGTVSLTLWNGRSMTGAGEHAAVQEAAARFLGAAEAALAMLSPAQAAPVPAQGRMRFHALTFAGPQTAEVTEDDMSDEAHPLFPLFHAGHEVIAAIRQVSDQG
jgi:hypothetical protein